ncbi:MAG: hypothetical protein KA163_03035 [Bacteroidia bacterium]|nr:hypothetical protein [Bacteroidia bacterium]
MKNTRIIFIMVAFFVCFGSAFAQAKKKPAPKKKAAPKAISVYVCTDNKDKTFHKRRSCGGLNKCSNEIKFVSSVSELKKYKRKSCARCNK